MGICCRKDIISRTPEYSQLIQVSSISKTAKLENIQKKFEFTRVIGYGVFGTVREALKISSTIGPLPPKPYAIKSIIKTKVERKLELLRRELEILKTVDHPNIIRLYEVYEDKKYLHLVTELCTGGDLLDYLLKKGILSEQEVLNIIFKALSAINYLHNLNICHRDIKPENFLLATDEDDAELKLVDFGMSNFVKSSELSTFAGTPYYIAPEVIKGGYNKECDIWSLGVLMYFLLSGKQPFHANSVPEVFSNILEANYDFECSAWNNVSERSKNLIKKMLVADPTRRVTVGQALSHKAFLPVSCTTPIQLQVFNSLKKFKAPSKLWNEAMMIFVQNFSIEQINSLKDAFAEIDKAKTGWITASDIAAAMVRNKYDMAYHDFSKLVENIEYMGKGKLNYSQFLIAAMDRKKEINEEHLWTLFKHFDLDDNGMITLEEMKYVLEKSGCNINENEADEIMEEFKSRAPNAMNYETFVDLMRCITEEHSEHESFRGSRRMSIKHHYTTVIRNRSKENVVAVNSIA